MYIYISLSGKNVVKDLERKKIYKVKKEENKRERFLARLLVKI